MQEALPAFVLNSETLPRKPMHDTPANPTNSSAQAEPQRPGMSDERLMLAFSQGSSESFTELFHRYKQPVYGFFCRRLADPANAEELTQNGEEVTQQHADLVARLKNSRETEMRLQDVLRTRTGKVKDVLEAEEEIA